MRMEAGRAEVLGICHQRRSQQVRRRRVRAFRRWLTTLIEEQAASERTSPKKAVDNLSPYAVECLRPGERQKPAPLRGL